MGIQFIWYPIVYSQSLEDVYKTYKEWPIQDDPREYYRFKKWFKTVNDERSTSSIEDLLSQYSPSLSIEKDEDEIYFNLPMPDGGYAPVDFTLRELTIQLGGDQQADKECLDQAYHFLAYLMVRGHGLVNSEIDGWVPPESLLERAEQVTPIPQYDHMLRLKMNNASESYSRWKKKDD